MRPLLNVDHLTVDYRTRRGHHRALADVSLNVMPGETVGLVGESGSGKSTLGKAVLGQVLASSGKIVFDGVDYTHRTRRQRLELCQQLQVVFQNPYLALNPQRTIGQSVAETLTVRKDLSKSDIHGKVVDALAGVGLEAGAAHRYPASFSGGQRQRIAIARALLPRPKLVVCDEAVSALDLSIQAQVLNLLMDLQDELGTAYLFITHDISVVRHLCHRVVVLRNGRLIESGDTSKVCTSPTDPYTQQLISAAPIPDPDGQARARTSRTGLLTPA